MGSSLLGDLTVSFKVDLSGLTSGISQAKSEMSGIGDVASSASSSVSSGFMGAIGSVVSFGAQVGQTIFGLQQLAGGAVSLAQSLLQPAATAETTTLSFTTLLHSTQLAKNEMVALNTFAAGTPLQTQWVDNAAAKILAFGGTTKSIIPEITSIGDSLSGLGKLSETSLNSIVDIFGKISAQGKLTGGDMMQLSTWGIPAWQALSDAMGKPIPVLQKMVSSGLIPASIAIPALEKGMEKTFGGGMAKQANTFTGIISTLASNWQIAMAAFGSPLLQLAEQGLGRMGSVLSSSAFQTFAGNVGQKIADVFGSIVTNVSKLGPLLSGIGQFVVMLADGWNDLFYSLDISQIVASFNRFQQALQNFGATVGPVLGPLLNNINNLLISIGGLIGSLVAPALDMLTQRVNGAAVIAKPLIMGLSGIVIGLQLFIMNITPVIAGIASFAAQSNVLPTIFNMITTLLTQLADGWKEFFGMLDASQIIASLSHFQQVVQNLSSTIGPLLGPLLNNINNLLISIAGTVFSIVAPAFSVFTQLFNGAIKIAQPLIGGLSDVIVGLQLLVMNMTPVATLLTELGDDWKEFFSGLDTKGMLVAFNEVKVAVQQFVATIGPLLAPLLLYINYLFTSFAGLATSLVAPALTVMSQVINGVTSVAKPLVEGLSGIFFGLQQLVTELTPTIAGFVQFVAQSGVIPDIFNLIAGALNFVMPLVSGLVQGLADLVNFFQQNQAAAQILGDVLIGIGAAIAAIQIGAFIATIPALVAGFIAWATTAGAAAIATVAAALPIIAIGAAIALVVVGIILAVQHWGAISTWLVGVWKGVQTFFVGLWGSIGADLQNFLQGFINRWNSFWSGIITGALNFGRNLMQAIANGISGAVGAVGNAIHSAISSAFSGLGLHIPGFASGVTNYAGGWAMVGEKGPELMYVPQGASVYPQSSLPSSSPLQGSSTGGEQTIHVYLDGSVITTVVANRMMKQVRVRTGLKV